MHPTVGTNAPSSPHLDPGAEGSIRTRPGDAQASAGRNSPSKQSLEYVLKSGLAGGLAGCAAKTVVGPLDRVKILFQASSPQFAKYSGSWAGLSTALQDIYHQDGTVGLFKGHSATLLRIFPYAAIKFLAYEQIRALVIPGREQETAWRRLVSGSTAGLVSVFVTYPLEVVRVRLAFDTSKNSRASLGAICRQIYHEQPRGGPTLTDISSSVTRAAAPAARPRSGLRNFYRGFSPTLWGMLPYAGMSFLTHDTVGDLLRHPSIARYTIRPSSSSFSSYSFDSSASATSSPPRPPPLRSWAELVSGGFAGLVSQTASYPLEVIRRRMQVSGAVGDGHRLRIAETAALVWREKGARGFYVGLTIGYLKVVPMVATSFFVYERTKVWLGI
ncbi:MAG: hypothetical protein M1826_002264 [Phylliscum demangeonii]|nr:MAG: hypothetical protein M1826_002264 [Phylliscum demangeonii]